MSSMGDSGLIGIFDCTDPISLLHFIGPVKCLTAYYFTKFIHFLIKYNRYEKSSVTAVRLRQRNFRLMFR